MEVTKKKSFEKRFSLKNIEKRTFTISIDGSDTAEYAFDLCEQNFLTFADHLYAVYIFNSQKDSKFNYKNKKEIIEPKYQDKIESTRNPNIHFFSQDRANMESHPLEQVHGIANSKASHFLICGFTGMKGPRGDNEVLTKGINYLLKEAQLPYILIKDKTEKRDKHKHGNYRWLVVVNNSLSNAHTHFENFLPLIETDKDEVVIVSMHAFEGQKDYTQEVIVQECKDHNIKNFTYETFVIGAEETASKVINKRVNFEQDPFDFVMMLNNKVMFNKELEKNTEFLITLKAKSNICILNQ